MAAEDATPWTMDDLQPGRYDAERVPPTRENAADLCRQYSAEWTDQNSTPPTHVFIWLAFKFRVDVNSDDFYADFQAALVRHHSILGRLKHIIEYYQLEDEVGAEVVNAARVIYSADSFFRGFGKMYTLMAPTNPSRRGYAHADLGMLLNSDDNDGQGNSGLLDNCFSYDQTRNTHFQNLILKTRELLDGMDMRRAGDSYFKRVKRYGVEMLAFEKFTSIEAYVAQVTGHAVNFEMFKLVTASPHNGRQLVDYLTSRCMPETPDLDENQYLRSFSGDAVGRGAVVYDCRSDFAFEYRFRSQWTELARNVREARRSLRIDNAVSECVAPAETDVAMTHLELPFPFDTYEELRVLRERHRQGGIVRGWRESAAWECTDPSQELLGDDAEALAVHIDALLPPRRADLGESVGKRWMRTDLVNPPEGFARVNLPADTVADIAAQTLNGDLARFDAEPPASSEGIPFDSCVVHGGAVFVPLRDVHLQPRVVVDAHEWRRLPSTLTERVHTGSFVRHGDRFFRVDTGRTHWDVPLSEVEQIFVCQEFEDEDGFTVYALMGRTLYKVGEFDRYTITLYLEGIGGSGKTTLLSAHTALFPYHRVGIISVNMQEQFGMGAVVMEGRAALIICNEVSKTMKIRGEEWQQSMDCLPSPYPRKYKEPWVGVNNAQHFWVGNEKPLSFRNDQGQVTRRLAGVMLGRPVRPRDASIIVRIRDKLAFLLRKEVLAYAAYLRKFGDLDPMSTPESLAPAFRNYTIKYRRHTDPMHDFLSPESGYVKIDETGTMLMSTFKRLYFAYREDNQMAKVVDWRETHYATAFAERAIVVQRWATYNSQGETHHDVDVAQGIREPDGQ